MDELDDAVLELSFDLEILAYEIQQLTNNIESLLIRLKTIN
jgi:hypothetical protein